MKPLPYVHLPHWPDHRRLIEGLHALGYRWVTHDPECESLQSSLDDHNMMAVNQATGRVTRPWVGLGGWKTPGSWDTQSTEETAQWCATIMPYDGPSIQPIRVNSVNHFLAYVRRVRAEQTTGLPS